MYVPFAYTNNLHTNKHDKTSQGGSTSICIVLVPDCFDDPTAYPQCLTTTEQWLCIYFLRFSYHLQHFYLAEHSYCCFVTKVLFLNSTLHLTFSSPIFWFIICLHVIFRFDILVLCFDTIPSSTHTRHLPPVCFRMVRIDFYHLHFSSYTFCFGWS